MHEIKTYFPVQFTTNISSPHDGKSNQWMEITWLHGDKGGLEASSFKAQPEIHLMVENIFSISILLRNNSVQTAEELQCHVTLNYTVNQLRYYQQNYILYFVCILFIWS